MSLKSRLIYIADIKIYVLFYKIRIIKRIFKKTIIIFGKIIRSNKGLACVIQDRERKRKYLIK